MPSRSPTERTLKWLRDDGYLAEVVERWVPGANVHKDLYGFIDIIAIKGNVTVAIQATSSSNVAPRVRKVIASPHLAAVRMAGWSVWVLGWGISYVPRLVDLTREDVHVGRSVRRSRRPETVANDASRQSHD